MLVASHARRAGLAITPAAVFEHRTPERLAGAATPAADAVGAELAEVDWAKAQRPDAVQTLPLSPLQEGLLFQATFNDQGVDAYVMRVTFDLHGPVDLDRLRAAVQRLLHRYPNL